MSHKQAWGSMSKSIEDGSFKFLNMEKPLILKR